MWGRTGQVGTDLIFTSALQNQDQVPCGKIPLWVEKSSQQELKSNWSHNIISHKTGGNECRQANI